MRSLIPPALGFWRDRNVQTCPVGVTVWQAPNLDDAWGRGDGATCTLWISDDLARVLRAGLTRPELIDACTAVTHEVGHALGLSHSPAGVMAGDGTRPPYPGAWAPMFCRQWAKARLARFRPTTAGHDYDSASGRAGLRG